LRLNQLLRKFAFDGGGHKGPALLALSDGSEFFGDAVGFHGLACGEVVFNTSMTGYQEIISDPSYCNQLVTLTYPHIGNVGCNASDMESKNVYLSGVIVKNLSSSYSNYRGEQSLNSFLVQNKVVGIANIDTRKLTLNLRQNGAMNGVIISMQENSKLNLVEARRSASAALSEFDGIRGSELANRVSVSRSYSSQTEPKRDSPFLLVYDFGIKKNILRILESLGCQFLVVPSNTSYDVIVETKPDGIILSNGPGDPEPCANGINVARNAISNKLPILGICLGHQVLALAAGAKTKKMSFGHHGANHPIQELKTNKIFITSQNHGFVVDENYLGDELVVSHKSLFDGSIQGIEHLNSPAFGFQGHPEGSPGPQDLVDIFKKFVDLLKEKNKNA